MKKAIVKLINATVEILKAIHPGEWLIILIISPMILVENENGSFLVKIVIIAAIVTIIGYWRVSKNQTQKSIPKLRKT